MRTHVTILATAALVAGLAISAHATPHVTTIFDSTGQTDSASREAINGQGPLGASFVTPGFVGGIASLTLDLYCPNCGTGSFSTGQKTTQAATASNVLHLASVSGYKIGDLVQTAAGGGISANTVWVTGVDGGNKTITLSAPVTVASGTAIQFRLLGNFTVSLNANFGATVIPNTDNPIGDIPGASIAPLTVYDAELLTTNANVTSAAQLYSFSNPFGELDLSADTAYWVTLANGSSNSKTSWELVTGGGGAGVVGNYFNGAKLDTATNCGSLGSGVTRCSFLNYSNAKPTPSGWRGKAFGMEVQYVPEPASLALLATGLAGLGLRLRHRSRPADN